MFLMKIILTFVLIVSIRGTAFAQNNIEAMRFLEVTAMMQYGQKLYDRGDFNEACAVFDHVLLFDSHQAQALEYLREMGRLPRPIPETVRPVLVPVKVLVPVSVTRVFQEPGRHLIQSPEQAPRYTIEPEKQITVATINIADTVALKKAIEAKRQAIAILRAQIKQMQDNIISH